MSAVAGFHARSGDTLGRVGAACGGERDTCPDRLDRSNPAGALLVGTVFGAVFFFTHLIWVGQFLGPVPWVALAARWVS